jgi:ribosomal protein L27
MKSVQALLEGYIQKIATIDGTLSKQLLPIANDNERSYSTIVSTFTHLRENAQAQLMIEENATIPDRKHIEKLNQIVHLVNAGLAEIAIRHLAEHCLSQLNAFLPSLALTIQHGIDDPQKSAYNTIEILTEARDTIKSKLDNASKQSSQLIQLFLIGTKRHVSTAIQLHNQSTALALLPIELSILYLGKLLDTKSLGRLAQASHLFRQQYFHTLEERKRKNNEWEDFALLYDDNNRRLAIGLRANGTILEWENNIKLEFELPVKQIANQFGCFLFLLNNGTVKAFGHDYRLQEGIFDDNFDQNTPTLIPHLTNVKQIATGRDDTLFLLTDGTVQLFNLARKGFFNDFRGDIAGGLDLIECNEKLKIRTLIPELTDVTQVSAGSGHMAFLLSNGTVKVYGNNNHGQLGLDDNHRGYEPTLIPDLTDVMQVIAIGDHTLFLLKNGTVKVCGKNDDGQLGLNDHNERRIPTLIPNLTNVSQIGASERHTMFLLSDGTVSACGNNTFGQLGLGDKNHRETPTPIPDIENIVKINTNEFFSLLVMSDNTIKITGHPVDGTLRAQDSTSPINALQIHFSEFIASFRKGTTQKTIEKAITTYGLSALRFTLTTEEIENIISISLQKIFTDHNLFQEMMALIMGHHIGNPPLFWHLGKFVNNVILKLQQPSYYDGFDVKNELVRNCHRIIELLQDRDTVTYSAFAQEFIGHASTKPDSVLLDSTFFKVSISDKFLIAALRTAVDKNNQDFIQKLRPYFLPTEPLNTALLHNLLQQYSHSQSNVTLWDASGEIRIEHSNQLGCIFELFFKAYPNDIKKPIIDSKDKFIMDLRTGYSSVDKRIIFTTLLPFLPLHELPLNAILMIRDSVNSGNCYKLLYPVISKHVGEVNYSVLKNKYNKFCVTTTNNINTRNEIIQSLLAMFDNFEHPFGATFFTTKRNQRDVELSERLRAEILSCHSLKSIQHTLMIEYVHIYTPDMDTNQQSYFNRIQYALHLVNIAIGKELESRGILLPEAVLESPQPKQPLNSFILPR